MADRDQAASEADQRVSDRDQALADRELEDRQLANPIRLRAHEQAKTDRGEGTVTRMATTVARVRVASERYEQAWRRDEMARHRDEVATGRDREAEEVDESAEKMARQLGIDSSAAKVAAVARASAAAARLRAAEDRERAARDREDAARDRELLMAEVERSHMDESTGAYGRRVGEVLLRHEVERARGIGFALTLGVVTMDGAALAGEGHDDSAHAARARDLFLALRTKLRPVDLIVRWSESEFVSTLAEIDREEASRWLTDACADVLGRHPDASTTIGVALEEGDTLDGLVERARSSS